MELVRCADCVRHLAVWVYWCPVAGKWIGGPKYRRRCDSFVPLGFYVPEHGYVIEDDPPPLRLWDGAGWLEVPQPRFKAPLQVPSWH